jgi:shikimate dehydrogenase
MVMGACGASRAIVHALLSAGSGRVSVVNRTFERAKAIAEAFGARVSPYHWDRISTLLPDVDLIVNTTPLGMEGHGFENVDLLPAKENVLVTDIVYVPLETPLIRSARMRGLKTVDGLGMLLHQAVPGFEKWFGVRPEVDDDLRLHLLSVLAARAAQ